MEHWRSPELWGYRSGSCHVQCDIDGKGIGIYPFVLPQGFCGAQAVSQQAFLDVSILGVK